METSCRAFKIKSVASAGQKWSCFLWYVHFFWSWKEYSVLFVILNIASNRFKRLGWNLRFKRIESGWLRISRTRVQNWNFGFPHILSGESLQWTIYENRNKTFQRFFVFENSGKTWNAVIASQPPLNFDEIWCIFKLLGKEDGRAYWNDLLKFSQASFWEYSLMKILVEDVF